MKPLVSILIPAYNAEEYIGETLESAVAQTYPHREIIVVNDGSRDRTLEIARSFEPRGVTVVTQQNQGAAAARNYPRLVVLPIQHSNIGQRARLRTEVSFN